MSEPLILKIKNKSKIVATSKVRQPIAKGNQAKVTFDDFEFCGKMENLTFSNNEIIIGKGVKKISIKAKVYSSLLKTGAYAEIKITKNSDSNVLENGIAYGSDGNERATITAEAEIVDVTEGDRIYLLVYNSNTAISIALDSFITRYLAVEVLE